MNKDKQQLYISPEVEVIETQVQTVICESGRLNDMNREDSSEW